MSESTHTEPTGQSVVGRAALVAMVTMIAVGVLDARGLLLGPREALDMWFLQWMGESFERVLPVWVQWVAGGLLGVVLPVLLLHAGGGRRRLLLWVSFFVVTVTWAPVLALAAYRPDVVVPCLVVLLSGAFALVCSGWGGPSVDDAASDEAS